MYVVELLSKWLYQISPCSPGIRQGTVFAISAQCGFRVSCVCLKFVITGQPHTHSSNLIIIIELFSITCFLPSVMAVCMLL